MLENSFGQFAVPENIHTPPTEGSLCFHAPLPPGNSSLGLYFAYKILAFKTPSS